MLKLDGRFYFTYLADDDKDGLMSSDKNFVLTNEQKEIIVNHYKKNRQVIKNGVHTVYDSLERYYRLHDRIGHSKEEATKFINEGKAKGEFLFLESGEIIQFD